MIGYDRRRNENKERIARKREREKERKREREKIQVFEQTEKLGSKILAMMVGQVDR
jgi:F0F1-type ATP synthase assembly protein I